MTKRYRAKYLKSLDVWVLHVFETWPISVFNEKTNHLESLTFKPATWRRLWGYTFATESLANQFARGRF